MVHALGDRRLPWVSDRDHLPYMQAIVLEVLRLISHVPTNLPHYTLTDTRLGEYDVLKNTQVQHHSDILLS